VSDVRLAVGEWQQALRPEDVYAGDAVLTTLGWSGTVGSESGRTKRHHGRGGSLARPPLTTGDDLTATIDTGLSTSYSSPRARSPVEVLSWIDEMAANAPDRLIHFTSRRWDGV
jgi:hypothetical protein